MGDIPFESQMDVARDEDGGSRRRRWLYAGGAAAVAAVVATALFGLDPAAPSVERSAVLVGTVERGLLVRQVRGPGTLVPERMRIVSAVTAGRVDEVRAEAGEAVDDTTVLVELSNPDVELEALEAQRQLTAAQARLVDLRQDLGSQVLTQESSVASARAEWFDARRQAAADSALTDGELIPRNDALRSRERADAAATKLETERQRLALLEETLEGRLDVQRQQVGRLRSIYAYHQRRVESMRVTAGSGGVLQDFDLEPGQWIQSGTVLARVAEPGRLTADLRIPQTQARDVRPGQPAVVDTRGDTVAGVVKRVDPNVQNGSVLVEVAFEDELPPSARPDLSVDGYVEIQRLEDVLHVERPAFAQADGRAGVFRLEPDGDAAVRVPARFGAGSVNRIQVLEGLEAGDRIIVSDMSRFDDRERVRVR